VLIGLDEFPVGYSLAGCSPAEPEWNANLTVGKVVIIGNAILYTSSSWLSRTDADALAQDAVLGHYLSKDLRKEIAPLPKAVVVTLLRVLRVLATVIY